MTFPSSEAAGAAGRLRPPVEFPTASAPLYTVGQVADMLGVRAAFLRRLDTERAVTPGRSPGGQRRYSRDQIDHVNALNGLMSEGMTLAGAQRIIALEHEVAELRRLLDRREPPSRP